MKYRPEIDGLRAIAVVSVILYHAQITILGYDVFKGGFIGVDIFFVISGYLITSIIYRELQSTGSFSFKKFYERRVRRIIPVLLLVILTVLPLGWMYLLPLDFVEFSKSALFSLGFSSNLYFHYDGQQYGAASGLLKPLLHTWSLSVEEQYYLFFPIIFFILFKFLKKYLIHFFLVGLILSVLIADWSSKTYPSISFYFLHTRIWELFAGSILAYLEIKLGNRSENKILNSLFPFIGLVLIGFSIYFFNDRMFHPSFNSLPPVIGVSLIIWFSSKDDFITKILSSKLFVGIGLISYSLYLWHYPIFAFSRITQFTQGDISKKILLSIIILIISIISYFLVEKPFRNRNNKMNLVGSFVVAGSLLLIILNYAVIKNNGFQKRLPNILQNDLKNTLTNSQGENCYNNIHKCKFNTSSNKKIFLIGDSHMEYIMSDLKNKVVQEGYQFIPSVVSGCIFFPNFDLIDVKTKKISPNCNNDYFQMIKKILSKEKGSIFIFGGRYPLYLTNEFFNNKEGGIEGKVWKKKYVSIDKNQTIENSFKKEVLKLSKNNKIILVYPIPEVGWDVPNKIWIDRKKTLKKNNYSNLTTSFKVYLDRSKTSNNLLDSINNSNIYRVYPHKLFCNLRLKGRCTTHNNKDIFYADMDHPSKKGAEMINDLIIKEIKNIEIKSN